MDQLRLSGWYARRIGNRRRRDVSSKFYDKANVIEAPSFVTVDLGASYKVNDNFGVSVKVNNLFDEKYYRSVGTTAQGNYYGEPRSVLVQAKATF
ncbi:TonB-dependent receptor domain-containing protein [Agrobacterium tumefaciens]|uniref:TonB-dependent receptor domain-containing protein n=1 Tax=Agrobacterium tumefaciens TaxID=358 RepID=UPI0022440496